jgi:hypothetical protein
VLPKRRVPDVANQAGGQQVPSAMTVDAQLMRLHRRRTLGVTVGLDTAKHALRSVPPTVSTLRHIRFDGLSVGADTVAATDSSAVNRSRPAAH